VVQGYGFKDAKNKDQGQIKSCQLHGKNKNMEGKFIQEEKMEMR
jgi:hypothetical protein